MTMSEATLFTQPGCAQSAQVRTWLTDHGIAFTEQDAGCDREAADALAATGLFATPLLVVDGQHLLGYRPDALAALLLGMDERDV